MPSDAYSTGSSSRMASNPGSVRREPTLAPTNRYEESNPAAPG
ncbi:hypothetical protein SF83666_c36390 [Sinorhizobium fredii CCBAU 83666]|nr:hypothetical protein SF83666_c36390 [Sinorhizobium fredii CCBAU 83666]